MLLQPRAAVLIIAQHVFPLGFLLRATADGVIALPSPTGSGNSGRATQVAALATLTLGRLLPAAGGPVPGKLQGTYRADEVADECER